MKVTYHVYKDYQLNVTGESDEEIFRSPKYKALLRRRRFSFVSMCYDPVTNKLFVGTSNGAGDLLVEFDVASGRFRSCGYQRSGFWDRTEQKIHKGIWLDDKERALYFGTTTLRPIPETVDSRGGALVRYSIGKRRFALVATPTPGDFYQATCYDAVRKKMYMFTMPGSCFGVYDVRRKKLVRHDPMESIPHIGAIDDAGGVWGSYGVSRHYFFRYLPDENRYEFPEGCAFPEARNAANVMYMGAGPTDAIINGGDGYLYAGSALGEVVRIDWRTAKVTYLGKPFPGRRMPGLAIGADGFLYLAGGTDEASMLARYDRGAGRFELLGPIIAKDGAGCYRCHELCVVGKTAYVGETDNRRRSGYLWACEV